MPEANTEKREASFDWKAAFQADFGDGETPVIEEKIEDNNTPDPNEKPDGVETTEVKVEDKTETKTEEKTPETTETKVEEKKEEKTDDVQPEIELNVEDVAGYKKPADEGTWKAVGELFEVDVPEENEEAFKTAVESKFKTEIEKARQYSLEQEYAKLKPETVTALKLIEMGYPQDEAFNPVAKHNELLKLDDASLVRKNYEGLDGWTEEEVNLKMEQLSERPEMLALEAKQLRDYVKHTANEKLAEREAILQKYTQDRENAIAQEREVSFNQVKEAVMNIESFMNAKVNPEARQAMLQKHSRGEYGNIKGDAKAVAEFIYFKEFGQKIIEETKRASYAKGREEFAKKELLRIPTKEGEPSKKVVEKVALNNQSTDKASILRKDFGEEN